jgi:hypothetical protein
MIIMGTILIVGSLLRVIIFHFWGSDDQSQKHLRIWVSAFGILAGCIMCFQNDKFRANSSNLSLVVLFGFCAIAISTSFSLGYHRFTAKFIPELLRETGIDAAHESLLYVTANLFSGFLIGVAVGTSKRSHKISGIDGTAIAYSIGVWFFNDVVLAGIGCLFSRQRSAALKYDSTPASISAPILYTSQEGDV